MTAEGTLLLVEDEAPQRRLVADILRREGWQVVEAPTLEAARAALAGATPELVLCDWRLPDGDGGELLDEVRAGEHGCAFVVVTAYGSIAHAVEAVRRGADDYLAKPFEREALLLAVDRVRRARRLERENRRLREEVSDRDRFGELLGGAPAMQRLYRTLEKIAASGATVLVTGESGTGKELVARALHAASPRARGRFVAVNCAAIPETLMESELFGHERGAFTGAHRRRDGRFAEAEGGTLFLDEVSSMPPALQGKLLRVLEERRFTRLGAAGDEACDVRVVAATNRALPELVAEGSFREDLYYRLAVVPVRVPPLRERREDLPLLAHALLERACRRHDRPRPALGAAVLRRLEAHAWPGNVRELANLMERLALLTEGGEVTVGDLPSELVEPAGSSRPVRLPAGGLVWDELEADLLRQALEHANGNRTAAARLLGLGYKAFLYRLEKHGLC